MEIWYYDIVPGVLNTELRLIFYQKNGVGFPKLYSPTTDTIRALLISEAATVHAFGPNDSLTESDVRQVLTVPPSDDEILSAAANVATGIKYSGNDEIIGLVTSPGEMLRRARPTEVTARLIVTPAKMDVFATPSPYGGEQIDFRFEVTAAHELEFEILQDATPVYRNLLHLKFAKRSLLPYASRRSSTRLIPCRAQRRRTARHVPARSEEGRRHQRDRARRPLRCPRSAPDAVPARRPSTGTQLRW